jgi:hypothetical protein
VTSGTTAPKSIKTAARKMMGGENQLLAEVLLSSGRHEIPAYQRGYQWDSERWQDLIRDIVSATTKPAGANGHFAPYWIGIMIQSNTRTPGRGAGDRTLRIIDGQQRIVTLLCWLRALQDHALANGLPKPGANDQLMELVVQEKDREAMAVVMGGTWEEPENRHLLVEGPLAAYAYFRGLLHLGEDALASTLPVPLPSLAGLSTDDKHNPWTLIQGLPRGTEADPEVLYEATLTRVAIFSMSYDQSDTAEAGLFDALNGKRTELEPLDYMRSALFVRLDENEAHELHDTLWRPCESTLYDVSLQGVRPGRNFPYDFLISLGDPIVGEGISAARAHLAFARLMAAHDYDKRWLTKLVKDQLLPAMTAWPAVVGSTDSVLRKNGKSRPIPAGMRHLMTSIFAMSRQPVNPLVLHIVCAWNRGAMSEDDAVKALGWTEAYVARWLLAGRKLNNLRADIIGVMSRLKGSADAQEIRKALQAGQWATDDEVKDGMLERPFYGSNGPKRSALEALLRGIERAKSGGEWPTFKIGRGKDDYNIEHIYPQAPGTWAADLRKWGQKRDLMDERVHSLGNLTVVTSQHNKKVRNKTLKEKREETSLLRAPMLHLNTGWLEADRWTRNGIDSRTKDLFATALSHWTLT